MVLIKGAQIIDGSGKPPLRADVLLQGDKISAIGNFPNKSADAIIDGLGFYLAPGFIDVNTDSDHYLSLFTNPSQKDFLLQGVTTIVGGHCGASLAPLLYGTLESIRKWTNINQINVDWHTVGEFFKALGRFRLGVNFGTLAGHATIRRALIGDDFRDLTESESGVFKKILRQALEEGALGLSTGLGYAHSRQTPYGEIKELAAIVKEFNGVYTTHLRNEQEGLMAAVNETIKIAQETGVKTIISHFRPLAGFEKNFEDSLALIEKTEKADIYFDSYPFDTSVVPIYTLLPVWAQNGGLEVMTANLETPQLRDRILKELPQLKGDDLTIAYTQTIENMYLTGKSIGQIAENQGVTVPEAILKVMLASKMKALVFYKNVNLDLVTKSLMSVRALVSSNAASLAETKQIVKHERFFNTFPRFLEIIGQTKELTLEAAIKKITSVPAAKFSFKNRGLIKEGYFADLVLFKDAKVHSVFINGRLAVKDGKLENVLAGKILRRT